MKNSVSRLQPEKSYQHRPEDDKLPLVPGANFHDDPLMRNTLRKSHNLRLDRKVDHAPHTEYFYTGGTLRGDSTKKKPSNNGNLSGIMPLGDDAVEENVWDGWGSEAITEEEKKYFVVNFLAFFKEHVPESAAEQERVRQVCISYYVQDNSVSIQELRQENSGIVQGKILARQCVPRFPQDPTDVLQLDDFRIGETVKIYGTEYMIVDMNARARRYFEEVRGETPPRALECPEDAFTATSKQRALQNTTRVVTADDMDRKRAEEQKIKGFYSKHSNEDLAIAQQFLKNRINEHLSYLALWDDRGKISGDLHYCLIRLYLENFSIEVIESRPDNSGSSGSPTLIMRQRIPKAGVDVTQTRHQEHTYGKLLKSGYICPEDLQVGETHNFYGKPFYIYDADSFTRDYVSKNFGVVLQPAVDITPFVSVDKKRTIFYPPPPNGFGSEREKRDNWLKLVAKTARIDQDKISRETGRIMNFSARLARPLVKGDEEREFIVTFHRETDELEINERPKRNSGFQAGRFLAKGQHRKTLPDGTTRPYRPEDFVEGQEVVIYDRPFLLLAMDEGTKRILANTDNPTTEFKVKNLVLLFKQQINLKFRQINEAFLGIAPKGTLGFRQVREFLRSCSCDISEEEALLIVQNVSPGNDGVITYDRFQKLMNVSEESMDAASLTVRSVKNVDMKVNQSLKEVALSAEEKRHQVELKKILQEKLIQRKGSTQEQFRLLSEHSANSRMSKDAFRRSINEVMHFNMSKKDEDLLVSMLFDNNEDENGEITYKQFQIFVDSV